ncbi:MAG TPA: cytochrome P450 [Solirubrobacterales bacterium]|nr:cytochrome P450 [Solirubrobacterales bacterium]
MSVQRAPFPVKPPVDLSGAPPGPRLPRHLLGMLWLLREPQLLELCRRRYGDIFSLKAWPIGLLVVISDPAEIKRVFTSDPDVVHAGDGNAVTLPVAGKESVLLLDGQRHLHRRKLMLPPFHGDRLSVYGGLIGEVADEEIDRWPLDTVFPMHSAMQSITLKVILLAVFGIEDAERRAELERLIPKMINSPALLWPPLQRDLGSWSPWRRFLALRDKVDSLLFEEIERKRKDPELENRDDILSLLLQARDENGEPMGDEELRDQLVTLLLAGHETSATSLAWTFERLLRNEAVLARLRNKLAAGDEEYLDCVITESLRSRPIIPYAMRRLTEPFEIGGYEVPAGAFVGSSTTLVHNRPDLYPDPEVFRPERFEDKRADTYAWIPFGGGVRRCLGASFATFEMKIVLGRVIERCDLAVPDPKPERPRGRFVTYVPARGARVILRQRRPASSSVSTVFT